MKTKTKKIILGIILAGLVVILAFTFIWSFQVISEIRNLKSLISEARLLMVDGLDKSDFENANLIAVQAKSSLDKLNINLAHVKPLINFAQKFPGIGQKIQLLEPGMTMATNLVNAAVLVGQISGPLLQDDLLGAGDSPYELINSFLNDNQSNFAIIEEYFQNALAAREMIDPQFIPEKYRGDFLKIDPYLSQIPTLIQFIDSAPTLLGSDQPITYLLLIQNRDELRATGGFITAFGLVKLKEGRILALRVEDSTLEKYDYVSEIIEPPYPIKTLMFANYLVPRDANWSPDFPTAAKQTQDMFYLSTNISTDSVIAIDQQLIIDLLDFTGPILVPGEDSPISTENVEMRMIEYKQAAVDNSDRSERKDFLSLLGPLLVDKVLEYRDPNDLINLGKLLLDEIQKGHLLIYFNDPEIEGLLQDTGYDGAVRPGDGDYLMVIDSNVGFSKADHFIKRSINYSVDLNDPQLPRAKIQLTYEHTQPGIEPCTQGLSGAYQYAGSSSYFFSRCYWDYWRVYTRAGTKFENATLEPIPIEYFSEDTQWAQIIDLEKGENNTSIAGGLIVVKQDSSQKFILDTILPEDVIMKMENGDLNYKLRVQKQAGINSIPLQIEVKIPSGYQVLNQTDGWEKGSDNDKLVWNGYIDRTTDFNLEFFPKE